MKNNLILQDSLFAIKSLSNDSIDALVTDPPAGISFMGKDWDGDKGGRKQWVAWMTDVMRECHRVLKPGAHGLVWALPRTSHWTATALEDAGFEVRDVVTHLFGTGFPKSLNVEKAGAGKDWAGFGTALKPASEHWILVRKPCSEKTVAANVLKWGTGALNIDASRVESVRPAQKYTAPDIRGGQFNADVTKKKRHDIAQPENLGRFPANLVLSHTPYCTDDQCDIDCAVERLNEQSGTLKSGAMNGSYSMGLKNNAFGKGGNQSARGHGASEGGASRFFYCAKISKSERNAGLEGMTKRTLAMSGGAQAAAARGEEYKGNSGMNRTHVRENHHPTVKPKKLMAYLIRMVTPSGGVVLDPFMGSGSTGVAAIETGLEFIGIEKDPEYFKIASKRIKFSRERIRSIE